MSAYDSSEYAFGQEWADSLLNNFMTDPFAQRLMARLHLSRDDIRCYYLRQPFHDRVRELFDQQPESYADKDPVMRVLLATKAVKDESLAELRRGRKH